MSNNWELQAALSPLGSARELLTTCSAFWLTQGLPSKTALLLSITDACKGVPASPHLVKEGSCEKQAEIHMELIEELQPLFVLHGNSKSRTSVCCFSWKWKGGKRPWDRRGRREHELQTALPISSIFSFRTRDKAWALVPQSKNHKRTLVTFCLVALQTLRQHQEQWSQPSCYFSLSLLWHIHKIRKAAVWFHTRSKACTELICGKRHHCRVKVRLPFTAGETGQTGETG